MPSDKGSDDEDDEEEDKEAGDIENDVFDMAREEKEMQAVKTYVNERMVGKIERLEESMIGEKPW